MPKSTQAVFDEWRELLKAVQEDEGGLADIAPLCDELCRAHAQALAFRAVRDGLYASVSEVTRRLNAAMEQGTVAAISLRNYLKAILGPRSKKLVRYGIKPLRKGASG